jgi:hypothetical protein
MAPIVTPDGPKQDGVTPDGPRPDGPIVTPDGPRPDGPIVTPDGPRPDGPIVTPDGPRPDGPIVTPDGPIVTPDGPIVTPDGPIVTPDGPIVTPDGPIVTPDFGIPDGIVIPDITVPDGGLTCSAAIIGRLCTDSAQCPGGFCLHTYSDSSGNQAGICTCPCVQDNPATTATNEDTCPGQPTNRCGSVTLSGGSSATVCMKTCTPTLGSSTCAAPLTCDIINGNRSGLDVGVCIVAGCSSDSDCPVSINESCTTDGATPCTTPGSTCQALASGSTAGICTVAGVCDAASRLCTVRTSKPTLFNSNARVGDPCTSDIQCAANMTCLTEQTPASATRPHFRNGYCTITRCNASSTLTIASCPTGSTCNSVFFGGLCQRSCTLANASSCRGHSADRFGDYECRSWDRINSRNGQPFAATPTCDWSTSVSCNAVGDCALFGDASNSTNMRCRDPETGIDLTQSGGQFPDNGFCLDDTPSGPLGNVCTAAIIGRECGNNNDCPGGSCLPTFTDGRDNRRGVCTCSCVVDNPATTLTNEDTCPGQPENRCVNVPMSGGGSLPLCLQRCSPTLGSNTCKGAIDCTLEAGRALNTLGATYCLFPGCTADSDCLVTLDETCATDGSVSCQTTGATCTPLQSGGTAGICTMPGVCDVASGICDARTSKPTLFTASASVGDTCDADVDCGANMRCEREFVRSGVTHSRNGYCTIDGCSFSSLSSAQCPTGSTCNRGYLSGVCQRSCTLGSATSCRGNNNDRFGDYECRDWSNLTLGGTPLSAGPVCDFGDGLSCNEAASVDPTNVCALVGDTTNSTNMRCRDALTGADLSQSGGQFPATGFCFDDTASGN